MQQHPGPKSSHHTPVSSPESGPGPFGSDGSLHQLRCHLGSRKEKEEEEGTLPLFKRKTLNLQMSFLSISHWQGLIDLGIQ